MTQKHLEKYLVCNESMQRKIRKILEIAVHAPSGENAQPWRFLVKENQIHVLNVPEYDQSLYNYNQMGSYVAHGALIENMLIAFSSEGYRATPHLFPDEKDKNLVAIISFEESSPKGDQLYHYIEKRCTNRKPYKAAPLADEQLLELQHAGREIGEEGTVMFVKDRNSVESLARSGSMNERVMFDNKFLHNFFFTHINWTREEEEKKRFGFYLDTLELPPPIKAIFPFFRHWSVIALFNIIGFAQLVAKGNAKNYALCGAMGAVVVPHNSPRDFVVAGRIMQRVWLTATRLGLSVQPLTGVLFFMQGIREGQTEKFTETHLSVIREAYQTIYKTFGVEDKIVAMMFRIGLGEKPTAVSLKRPPEVAINSS